MLSNWTHLQCRAVRVGQVIESQIYNLCVNTVKYFLIFIIKMANNKLVKSKNVQISAINYN